MRIAQSACRKFILSRKSVVSNYLFILSVIRVGKIKNLAQTYQLNCSELVMYIALRVLV